MPEPKLKIAKRGTYCDAVVPDSTYFGAHPCLKTVNIKRFKTKDGVRHLCPWHKPKEGSK